MNKAELTAERDRLFQIMLREPDNLNVAFAYTALSVRLGDLEAGVATLERMLLYAPGLPRLKLELGLLYYRLEAYETARIHLEDAIASNGIPEQARQRAENLIARMDDKGDGTRFSATTYAGLRYQTNANRTTEDATILLGGAPATLASGARGEDDGNVFIGGSLFYSTPTGLQGIDFETNLIGQGSFQFERDELNIVQGELTSGFGFDLDAVNLPQGRLGLYGIAGLVLLQGDIYNTAFGVGSRFSKPLGNATNFAGKLEYRYRDFSDAGLVVNADDRTGHDFRLGASIAHLIDEVSVVRGGLDARRITSGAGRLSYSEVGGKLSYTRSISPPPVIQTGAWLVTVGAGALARNYDEPDFIFSTEFESSRQAFAFAALSVPLTDDVTLRTDAEYRTVSSNYDIRDYDNFSLSISLSKKW